MGHPISLMDLYGEDYIMSITEDEMDRFLSRFKFKIKLLKFEKSLCIEVVDVLVNKIKTKGAHGVLVSIEGLELFADYLLNQSLFNQSFEVYSILRKRNECKGLLKEKTDMGILLSLIQVDPKAVNDSMKSMRFSNKNWLTYLFKILDLNLSHGRIIKINKSGWECPAEFGNNIHQTLNIKQWQRDVLYKYISENRMTLLDLWETICGFYNGLIQIFPLLLNSKIRDIIPMGSEKNEKNLNWRITIPENMFSFIKQKPALLKDATILFLLYEGLAKRIKSESE